MTKFDLLEALNDYQRYTVLPSIEYDSDRLPGIDSSVHDKVFAKYNNGNEAADKIIIPTDAKPSTIIKPNPEVLAHLAKHGWTVHDYIKGMAVRQSNAKKADGSPKIEEKSIGSVLKDTGADSILSDMTILERVKTKPHPTIPNKREPVLDKNKRPVIEKYNPSINQLYETDPIRSASKNKEGYQIVISRNPEDVVGMSTHRAWTSCMRMPSKEGGEHGCNYEQYLPGDLAHKTLTAYLTKRGDDNIESPITRLNIKRLIDHNGESTYRPFGDMYGQQNEVFSSDVHKFAKENYPANKKHTYILPNELYEDGYDRRYDLHTDEVDVRAKSPQEQIANDFHGHISELHSVKVNEEGLLHTDNDDPSAHFISNGEEVKLWHRNGVLHRDNGPAFHSINDQSDNPYESYIKNSEQIRYYQHGMLHSPKEGGIPSYKSYFSTKGGSFTEVSRFHKFDILHNDPIHKIAVVTHAKYNDGSVETSTTKQIYGRIYEEHVKNEHPDYVTIRKSFTPMVKNSISYGVGEKFPIHNFITETTHVINKSNGKTSEYYVSYAPGCETISHHFVRENDDDEFGHGVIIKCADPANSKSYLSKTNTIKYKSREPMFVDTINQDDLNYTLPDKVKQGELFKK